MFKGTCFCFLKFSLILNYHVCVQLKNLLKYKLSKSFKIFSLNFLLAQNSNGTQLLIYLPWMAKIVKHKTKRIKRTPDS